MSEQKFPLAWPIGWKRTNYRTRAKFAGKASRSMGAGQWQHRQPVSIAQGIDRVLDELYRFGVRVADVTISSNLQLRNDGLPRSGQPEPKDPGVAVYWKKGKETRCMAIDKYDRIADNLAAVAATLEAMRQIERHGGATILDRAFQGFTALPAPPQWWDILDVPMDAEFATVQAAYRRLASLNHPDRTNDDGHLMARINIAFDQAREQHDV